MNQSMNESVNQSIYQSINEPINQTNKQSNTFIKRYNWNVLSEAIHTSVTHIT